jgi:sec-independent protein translocase protein TatB
MQHAASEVEQSIASELQETERTIHSAWQDDPLRLPPTSDQLAVKVRNFRKKKLARNSAIPSWYKHRHGGKTRVISAAARVAKYRPASSSRSSSFY